jgi:hypothetical protein
MGYILFLQGLKARDILSAYGTAESRALTLVSPKKTFFRNLQKPTP